MRSRTELRGEILAAARAEFAQHGLAGARIDRIARNAQASKERLYAHFGDKAALFREVVAEDSAEFFRVIDRRRDNIPEFVGEVFDLARNHPEHVRMITWARLEGFALDEPQADGQPLLTETVKAVRAAQAAGQVDPWWEPADLIVLLLGMALAWANSPDPFSATADATVIARRRAGAVEAAGRIIAARR